MDIKNLNSGYQHNRINQEQSRGAEKSESRGQAQQADDRVTISSGTNQLMELEAKAMAAKPDNSARIAELREQIANGTYQVNSQRVAEKIIATEVLY